MAKKSPHRNSIIHLYRKEVRQIEIACRLFIDRSLVSRTIDRYKSLGSNSDLPGRHKKATVIAKVNIKRVRKRVRHNNKQQATKKRHPSEKWQIVLPRHERQQLSRYFEEKGLRIILTIVFGASNRIARQHTKLELFRIGVSKISPISSLSTNDLHPTQT